MRQVTGLISTYSSDVFGICSALYELGGMIVMHDASGCNSTYTTHDEPRWYDEDSMIYISAISEMEAILGDDEKWIRDLTDTALELEPKFIALILAPIPYMIGTDVDAVARIVSKRTGIPCFAFQANGMHDYTAGVSKAQEVIAGTYAAKESGNEPAKEDKGIAGKSDTAVADDSAVVNFLGVTPLDIPLNGTIEAMLRWVTKSGMRNGACLSVGCTPEDLARLPQGDVNLVVSSGGLAAAKLLEKRFGTPYVVGVPYGEKFSGYLAETLRKAADSGRSSPFIKNKDTEKTDGGRDIVIIGESVSSVSLAEAIEMGHGLHARVLCPLEAGTEILRPGDIRTPEEDDIIREVQKADVVIADPLYGPLIGRQKFYPLPHTAFSGRIYEKEAPILIAAGADVLRNKLTPAE